MDKRGRKDEMYTLEIQSEHFERLRYLMKEKHVIILGRHCGNLSVGMENLRDFIDELIDIADVWDGVRT